MTNSKPYSRTVDFEVFRPDLDKALAYSDGCRPFDPVLIFKILVIQTLNNLSDERTEYLINDRLSFMHFLGLGLSDRVPDVKTVWLFRERLTRLGRLKECLTAVLGFARATMRIGLENIIYNMCHFLLLERINAAA